MNDMEYTKEALDDAKKMDAPVYLKTDYDAERLIIEFDNVVFASGSIYYVDRSAKKLGYKTTYGLNISLPPGFVEIKLEKDGKTKYIMLKDTSA